MVISKHPRQLKILDPRHFGYVTSFDHNQTIVACFLQIRHTIVLQQIKKRDFVLYRSTGLVSFRSKQTTHSVI